MGKIDRVVIFQWGRFLCLVTEVTESVFHPVYLAYWLISGLAVSVFYLYTQRAAANGRLGRATQDTYYRETGGGGWHVAVVCVVGCMLAPPVLLIALVSRHIRSIQRLTEQRRRGEPAAVAESDSWAKATGDE